MVACRWSQQHLEPLCYGCASPISTSPTCLVRSDNMNTQMDSTMEIVDVMTNPSQTCGVLHRCIALPHTIHVPQLCSHVSLQTTLAPLYSAEHMALKSSISSAAGVQPKQRSQLIISSRSSHALSLNSARPGSRSLASPRTHQGPQQQQERGHLHLQLAAVKGDAEVQTETVDIQTQQSAPATEAWVWEDSTDGAAAYAAFFLWLALGSWPALQSLNIAGRQAVQYII